jgi:F0F1-type ATP synthase membrane subunit b/b'
MGESELLPNGTFFIQLGLFFICYLFLRTFVFGPYLDLLQARRDKTTGLKEQAVRDCERAEKLKTDYESFIRAERKKLNVWLDEERRQVNELERQTIQQARQRTSEELKEHRKKLNEEAERARKELEPLVSDYSSQIASKLIGRSVKVPSSPSDHASRVSAESLVTG